MISTIDELRIPVVKGQESLDALMMQQLLGSFDEVLTVDENGFTSIDTINLPNINYVDELRVTNKARIKTMITQCAKVVYEDFENAYVARNKKFIPFNEFDDLQNDLDILLASVLALYDALLATPVINMNVSNTAKVMSAISPNQALRVLVNEAKQQINFHTKNLFKDIRKTTRSIIDSGVRTIINDGEHRTVKPMYSAVDSLMQDTISTVQSLVFNYVDKDIQFDGVEISVHFNSAPDHEPVQGHQFSNEEYNKLQSAVPFHDYANKYFDSIARPIGMWNCRHFATPVLLGVTKPTYTQAELDALNNENEREIIVGDNRMSKHRASLLASSCLRKALRNKEMSKEATILGDTVLAEQYLKKYLKYNKLYKTLNKAVHAI